MTRKAIIISASCIDQPEKYLSGVNQDVDLFYNYLLSDTGGAWHASEIEVHSNTDLNTLKTRLSSLKADYTLTLFTGHGVSLNNGLSGLVLQLSSGGLLTLSDLINQSKKQLLIIDSCREKLEEELSKGLSDDTLNTSPSDSNSKARFLYDRQIELSDPGLVIVTSCSQGEISWADKNGSYFTRSLIEGVSVYSGKAILDIKQAFFLSLLRLSAYPTSQNPEYTEGKVKVRFPFAVKLPQ